MSAHRAPEMVVKDPDETRKINMDFVNRMASSEAISSVSDTTISPAGALTAVPSTSGTVVQYTLGAGKAQVAFTATASDDTLAATSHGFTNGDTVRIYADGADNVPTGLTAEDKIYYVVSSAANSLKLSLTSGGDAVDITADGQGLLVATYFVRCRAATDDSQTLEGEGECLVMS